MGEVIPFKNIGMYLEDLSRIAGDHMGSITLSSKRDGDSVVWFGMVGMVVNDSEVRNTFTGATFNKVVLELHKFVESVV